MIAVLCYVTNGYRDLLDSILFAHFFEKMLRKMQLFRKMTYNSGTDR